MQLFLLRRAHEKLGPKNKYTGEWGWKMHHGGHRNARGEGGWRTTLGEKRGGLRNPKRGGSGETKKLWGKETQHFLDRQRHTQTDRGSYRGGAHLKISES